MSPSDARRGEGVVECSARSPPPACACQRTAQWHAAHQHFLCGVHEATQGLPKTRAKEQRLYDDVHIACVAIVVEALPLLEYELDAARAAVRKYLGLRLRR